MDKNVKPLDRLEEKALAYEQGKMLRNDSEIEIDTFYDEKDDKTYVWIADYSEIRGSAELIEKICSTDELSEEEIIKLCNKHGWCYSL